MREMKDSGIEWIGEIPESWNIIKVKNAYEFKTGWTPSTSKSSYFEGDIPWANISDIGKEKAVFDTSKHITQEAVDNSCMDITPKGSLMYSFKLSVGEVSFCGVDMYTNEAIASFLPDAKNDLRYLYYAAPIFIIKNANENIYGAKLLNQELIKNALILNPSLEEQIRIADYLDKKCSEIDALITAKEKTNELLKERRQSIIYEAVTKGLDPDVPMKDSGVEWIGDIPTNWNIGRAKYIYDVTLGKMLQPNPKSEKDELHSYMCAANITWQGIDLSVEKKMWFSPKDKKNYILKKGDLLVTEGGDVAVSCLWNEELSECYIQNAVHRVRPKKDASNRFLYYWLSTLKVTGYIDLVCNKATLAHFTKDKLDSCIVPILSATEQNSIADYLDEKCAEIDALISANDSTIEKLKEYRQSFIFEAVTGKIEV